MLLLSRAEELDNIKSYFKRPRLTILEKISIEKISQIVYLSFGDFGVCYLFGGMWPQAKL